MSLENRDWYKKEYEFDYDVGVLRRKGKNFSDKVVVPVENDMSYWSEKFLFIPFRWWFRLFLFLSLVAGSLLFYSLYSFFSPSVPLVRSGERITTETFKYKSAHGVKFLPMKVNGIFFDSILDTGSAVVSLNSDAVRKLGITHFTKKEIHSTAGGDVWAYYFPCSVALGSFEVFNLQCSYNPESKHNLLGGSFLKNFNYSINESEQALTISLL